MNRNIMDDKIYECLDLTKPRSFFLYAGAGSGKTRALVEVLKRFQENNIESLRLKGHRIAIITYTNAACDEIKKRLDYDTMFIVSTIHSFSWELIKWYPKDIKKWLFDQLKLDIEELEEQQTKGRPDSKAGIDRDEKIRSKRNRLENLDQIKKFTYNPNGENTSRDSLDHAEVIKITAFFLTKPLMQQVLINKYPFLLIDETQDTQKDLIDSFINIQSKYKDKFVLGLFGDMMQRIYLEGKLDLEKNISESWAKPEITINYRCPRRVVTLINKIRSEVDNHIQKPRPDAPEGIVRLFIIKQLPMLDKKEKEKEVFEKMLKISGDDLWNNKERHVKILTLEHKMAARRGGFDRFFNPLYDIKEFKTGLLDGTLRGISFFIQQVFPLVKALQAKDKFSIAQIAKKYSPLMSYDAIMKCSNPIDQISNANMAVQSFYTLWDNGKDPLLIDILRKIEHENLLTLPDILKLIAKRKEIPLEPNKPIDVSIENDKDEMIDAWDKALSCKFSHLESYANYITDNSRFGTHQGIKGLEFPRVMVILDDEEAGGFLFSYEKFLGAKEASTTDENNKLEGKETIYDRTRRLFYVTCSRAKESLAVVAYTGSPEKVKSFVLEKAWFAEDEIIEI